MIIVNWDFKIFTETKITAIDQPTGLQVAGFLILT